MNRDAALAYVQAEFDDIATEGECSDMQTLSAYSGAIDNALRQLGYAEEQLTVADVTNQALLLPYQALLQYYVLRRLARIFAVRFDVEVAGTIKAARSQAYKQVKALLDIATAEVLGYGYFVGKEGVEMVQTGRLSLDFLEPSGAEF